MPSAPPRRSALATGSSHEAGLRGRLEQFGLATVLTFLDLERRSGELLLVADEGVGRLWLREGRVIRVRIDGSRRAGRAAIYGLLALDRGRFSFTQMDIEGLADEIRAPTALLLMEAARRVDEAAASAGS
jgi:two-component system, OmpR family, response regulator